MLQGTFSFVIVCWSTCSVQKNVPHLIWWGWSPEGFQWQHWNMKQRQGPESDWNYWSSVWSPDRLCLLLSFPSCPWHGLDPGNLQGSKKNRGQQFSSCLKRPCIFFFIIFTCGVLLRQTSHCDLGRCDGGGLQGQAGQRVDDNISGHWGVGGGHELAARVGDKAGVDTEGLGEKPALL